ncbi:MAG: autotransporter-associated beta strand repeat-containing protein [Bacteroidaceae bacterium]|nr:autotransporter-associated beta strand repeat-containing protein [Bacteroidaceae bacterium]
MKKIFLSILLACAATTGFAQRFTDKIDRGLVAVPSGGGNFVSWHVFGEEYYDVTYNLYCNGSLIAQNLKNSSYTHASGNANSQYQVAAVVRGVEQDKCDAVKRWENGMLKIPVAPPTDRDGNDVSSHYTLNDVSIGDLDGDGIVEFIVKRKCDAVTDLTNKKMFHQLDCYDHKGNRLWWIDLGPNMLAGADEQWDCVCYDWDRDGKAEVLLRIQDNAYIHYADGSTQLIGSANVDTRWSGIEYTSSGNEYLLYLEGATGKPYEIGPASHPLWMDYPLTRESDSWWGSGIVGHRSTKHYWGAPFLDGRKASIFLGRGCYTNHKFIALDVDPDTHQLSQRWYWQTDNSASPWWGNGYHNFAIGDVDWDGRDEIIFGSMVIDDNGLGLSTTAYGHGDAQHCSDFDPYRKYEEQFACLEEGRGNFGCNYRNAATGQIYVKHDAGGDDGRALMGNFTNAYPGSVGRSVSSGWISSVADKFVAELNGDAFISWGDLNQRIYWDGDLLDEYFDSPGTEGYGAIYKPAGAGRWNFTESKCNNWSKNNPGGIADIFGDWREELIMRSGDNTAILVYTTSIPTTYRIPTLWHDHQYRNAMVWQSMGYNQPPHKSYFLGELEGITVAPPPYTMTDRTEIGDGGTITTTDEHLLICETNDTHISIQDGASPYMVTFNVPSWVQGTAQGNTTVKNTPITYDYYTCTVTGGALTGGTRLVKQGDGILTLPAADMTYTGETNIWAGTVNFNGSVPNSPVWINRFGELNSCAKVATFKSIKADYGSVIRPGGADSIGTILVDSIYYMGFGSRLTLDLYSDSLKSDMLSTLILRIEKKSWNYGPKYLTPVIEVVEHTADSAATLEPGRYLVAHADSLVGSLANIKIEGVTSHKAGLERDEKGDIYLVLGSVRGASEIVWTGNASTVWDYATTENFYVMGDAEQTPDIFVEGDIVNFTDSAKSFNVTLKAANEFPADTIRFDNTKAYTLSGTGVITKGAFVKENTGTVTMAGDNTYTGGNFLRGGVVKVSSLSSSTQAYGNLGGLTTASTKFVMENGAELQTSGTVKMGSPMRMQSEEGGVINNGGLFTMEKLIAGTKLTKKGGGKLDMQGSLSVTSLTVAGGTFQYNTASYSRTTTLQGSGVLTGTGFLTTPINVEKGAKASLYTVNRATSTNRITGEGQITIYCATEKGGSGNNVYYATRSPMQLNLTAFEGTLVIGATNNESAENGATGRVFTLDIATGAPKATFNIPENFILLNTARTYRIGQVTGKGALGGNCSFSNNGGPSGVNTWQVGNEGDFTFDGIVSSNAKFVKMGEGKMTASGKWTTSGTVTVSEGELFLKSGATLGTGAVTVAKGAIFSGTSAATNSSANKAPMTNSSYTVNGTLHSGNSLTASSGYWNFGGKDLTFNDGACLLVGLNKCATATNPGCTTIYNIGTLTMKDGVTISAYLGSSTYVPTTDEAVPDSFRIFHTFTTAEIGNVRFDLPELPRGNYWDTSRINEGLLFIYYKYTPLPGDIDGDDKLTIEDITALISFYLGGGQVDMTRCDLDHDQQFTIEDITTLIEMYLATDTSEKEQ